MMIRKIVLVGILTALSAVLGCVKIPIMGVNLTLVLPVVAIGAALCGPWVGAWLTVIPNLITIFTGEAALFMAYRPGWASVIFILKGLLAGIAAGFVYKLISKKHPVLAATCASVVCPVVNSGVFVLGCKLFLWAPLVEKANEAGVGIAILLLGLVGINFTIELVLSIVLCPSVVSIIKLAEKKKLV